MNSISSILQRLSAYRLMWVIVLFDLPTITAEDQKIANEFRKKLLEEGFTRFQFSIYTRACPSRESAEVYVRRIERILPTHGKVGILTITDKQFAAMKIFYGNKKGPHPDGYQQLQLF